MKLLGIKIWWKRGRVTDLKLNMQIPLFKFCFTSLKFINWLWGRYFGNMEDLLVKYYFIINIEVYIVFIMKVYVRRNSFSLLNFSFCSQVLNYLGLEWLIQGSGHHSYFWQLIFKSRSYYIIGFGNLSFFFKVWLTLFTICFFFFLRRGKERILKQAP